MGSGGGCLCGGASSSLTVLQALREGVGQASGPDRRRGARDVVDGSMIGGGEVVEVQQQPGGAGIAVAGLPDAARVQEPLALGEVEPGTVAAGLTGGELSLAADEGEGDVGVADQAQAMLLHVQA